MSQPLYFLPGVQSAQIIGTNLVAPKINRQTLVASGLGEVFADVTDLTIGCTDTNIGPDQRSGCIVYYQRPDGRLPLSTQYLPHAQMWHEIDDRLYIGVSKDAPPTPDDLARRERFNGYPLTLDSGDFLVPLIRDAKGGTRLPCAVRRTNGRIEKPIKAAYQRFWDASAEALPWFFDGVPTDDDRCFTLALMVLGLNYRIGEAEQNTLGIFDVQSMKSIVGWAVDLPGAMALAEAQKKTSSLSNAANTTPGSEEETPATRPLAAST